MDSQLKKSRETVGVYDQKGGLVPLDRLKKHDILLVFFFNCSEGLKSTEAILSFTIQGMDYHFTLIGFDQINDQGLVGRQASWQTGLNPMFFPWKTIRKIQIAGNDPTGRMFFFVEELFRQKAKAEKAAEKMRANIDALKA